jgi:hypothetical protein
MKLKDFRGIAVWGTTILSLIVAVAFFILGLFLGNEYEHLMVKISMTGLIMGVLGTLMIALMDN